MNSFYKKIGLFDRLNLEVEENKSELIEKLKKITYKANINHISLVFDTAIPTRFEYRGEISNNSFLIRRRNRFFDSNVLTPCIKGQFSEENNKTLISIEFFPSKFHILGLFLLLFFLICILILIIDNNPNKSGEMIFIIIPLVIYISHYFALKTSIKKSKYDFERELNFIAQKEQQM